MGNLLKLNPTSKPILQYYADMETLESQGEKRERSVRAPFQELLSVCARRLKWQFVPEQELSGKGKGRIIDGIVKDQSFIPRGYWEAKDEADDLEQEIEAKFKAGYPADNILFWTPSRIVLYQGTDNRIFDENIGEPEQLVAALDRFFEYRSGRVADWDEAVDHFKDTIPELGRRLVALIEQERKGNPKFIDAFDSFAELCRQSLNPNISDKALEEMLVQHVLTERIFRSVFDSPDFVQRNAIAAEIEKVVTALASKSFSRAEFMKPLARFYDSLEATARTIQDFASKQGFLNTIYERFFQGFAVKAADTMGIVYTPQPIVEFMINSVEVLLDKEFGVTLGDHNVHIIDPFVGTGNFIVRLMRRLSPATLPYKYEHELHCNELVLLPYYIAALNIEHEYLERMNQYSPFPGICLVDTFELAEAKHPGLFNEENTERVDRQRAADMMVILGNPPYNARQANENDNNKNRKYPKIDSRVAETFAKASAASNKNALNDPYIKAYRWASDRLREKKDQRGIVAFVSNDSFVDDFSFDGVRKCLADEFDEIYILDLGGNVRKNPSLSGTTHNVFGIQVGVSINFLVRRGEGQRRAKIHYARCGEDWRKERKYEWLHELKNVYQVAWKPIRPSKGHVWLRAGMRDEFDEFPAMGTKTVKRLKLRTSDTAPAQAVFKTYSNGIKTNRDTWVYNFDRKALAANVRRMVECYNHQLVAWTLKSQDSRMKMSEAEKRRQLDGFVEPDATKIGWSRDLKLSLLRGHRLNFSALRITSALYRPFTQQFSYFDNVMNEEVYSVPSIFPVREASVENWAICVTAAASEKPFLVLMASNVPDLHLVGAGSAAQCFPFFVYNEDTSEKSENITDWALKLYRESYGTKVSKWDIFHYHYAVLHHPEYRKRYAANLRKSLPHVPLVSDAKDFRELVKAGKRLSEIHVEYDHQPEFRLKEAWSPTAKANLRVEKMRLSKDRTAIHYNETLTLEGVPPEAFEYKLGNRSALEWVIDQYQVSIDKASGIENDPNREGDPGYIIGLIKRVVTVSLETQRIVKSFPNLIVT